MADSASNWSNKGPNHRSEPKCGAERSAKRVADATAERVANANPKREPFVFSYDLAHGQSNCKAFARAVVESFREAQRVAQYITERQAVMVTHTWPQRAH